MTPRGRGRASKVATGVASGSKAYVRHAGQVYGHSRGRAPGSKMYVRSVMRDPAQANAGRASGLYLPRYSIRAWDDFLRLRSVGTLAQVCAGGSGLGLARIDIDPRAPGANVIGDAYRLPLRDACVDTVACDPIYGIGFPERVRLQRELARVARRRILFKGPWIPRARGWRLAEALLLASHTCQNVAVLSVLERKAEAAELLL